MVRMKMLIPNNIQCESPTFPGDVFIRDLTVSTALARIYQIDGTITFDPGEGFLQQGSSSVLTVGGVESLNHILAKNPSLVSNGNTYTMEVTRFAGDHIGVEGIRGQNVGQICYDSKGPGSLPGNCSQCIDIDTNWWEEDTCPDGEGIISITRGGVIECRSL